MALSAKRDGMNRLLRRLAGCPPSFCLSLAVFCLAVGDVMAADGPWPEGVVTRIRVAVCGGLYEHEDFRANLILEAERLAAALPARQLPEPLTVTVREEGRDEAVPAEARIVPAGSEGSLPTRTTLEIAFLVRGRLPPGGRRDYVILVGGASAAAAPLKAAPPFAEMVPVEVRLFEMEVRGAGVIYRLPESALKETPFNGGFEVDPWRPDSVGPGWSAPLLYGNPNSLRAAWVDAGDGGKAAFLSADWRTKPGLASSPFEVVPGARYRLSFRLKAKRPRQPPGSLAAVAYLKFLGPGGGDDLAARWTFTRQIPVLRTDWTAYEAIAPAPRGAKWAYVRLGARNPAGVWWDDVKVVRVEDLPGEYRFESADSLMPSMLDEDDGVAKGVEWDADAGAVRLARRTNLVPEGSFEEEGGWEVSGPGRELVSRANDQSRDGAWSLRFGPLPDEAKAAPLATVTLKRRLRIDPSKSYALSVHYRGITQAGSMVVRLENSDGFTLAEDVLPGRFRQVPGSPTSRHGSGWVRRRVLIPAGRLPADAAHEATLTFGLRPQKKWTFHLDSICLVEGPDFARFSPDRSFVDEGFIVSEANDLGLCREARLDWDADVPDGAELKLFVRTGNTWYFDPATWDAWRPVAKGETIPILARGMDTYAQWKAVFRTSRPDATPLLRSVTMRRGAADGPLRSPRLRIVALDNGIVTPESEQFLASLTPLDELEKEPGYRALRRIARKVTEGCADDYDKQMALLTYVFNSVNNRYYARPKETRLPRPKENEFLAYRLLETGIRGEGSACSGDAFLYGTLCRTLGIPVRYYGLNAFVSSGHSMCDVWSDRHQKWFFLDCMVGGMIVREGVPQSILELHELFQGDRYHDLRMLTNARWRVPTYVMETTYGDPDESRYVGRRNRGSLFEMFYSAPHGWYREPDFDFMDDPYYARRGLAGRECFDFKLNQVEMRFEYGGGDELEVLLRQNALDFDHYEIEVAGRRRDLKENRFHWSLRPGGNRLSVRTVSRQGHKGKAFTADLWFEE